MRRLLPLLSLVLLLFIALPLSAQQSVSLDPSLLPSHTVFYLLWRGAPPADVRHANALMSFWDDPDTAQLRNTFIQSMLSDTNKQKDKPALTREELNDYAALFDNSFLIGYLPKPASKPATPKSDAPGSPAKSATTPAVPAWNGMFFVYDRTGKEAILSKAVLRLRGAETEIPKLTNLTVAGVSALKVERKSSVTYWAETGKYAVSANELSVFETILNRVTTKEKSASLIDSASYLEAKPLLSGGLMEFYLRLSDITKMAADSSSTNPQIAALVQNLKFDSLHLMAGHLSLEGAKTRFQGAILGDTSAGTLFDLWADGKASPDTLRFISSNTVSFNESEISFLGIYKVLKQAVNQASPNAAQLTAALESAAQTRLGMTLTDALSLSTGELASVQNSAALDDSQQVRILGIRSKPDALKLLRTIMGDKVSAEHNEGDVTYVKIALGGTQGSSGVTQYNFYHLAMTPDFLFAASKSEPLHSLLAQSQAASGSASAANILAARSKFPAKLNGFSYFDLQKVDWPAAKAKWIAESKESAAKAKTTDSADTSKKFTDWLITVDPAVFPRHFHSMTGASWKDAKGVHFDEWIE
jgi:hypothetical protein